MYALRKLGWLCLDSHKLKVWDGFISFSWQITLLTWVPNRVAPNFKRCGPSEDRLGRRRGLTVLDVNIVGCGVAPARPPGGLCFRVCRLNCRDWGVEGLNCILTQCSGELRGGELVHPSHGIPRLGDGGRGLRGPRQSGWRLIVQPPGWSRRFDHRIGIQNTGMWNLQLNFFLAHG